MEDHHAAHHILFIPCHFFAVASPAAEPVQVRLMSFNTWYGEGIELARSRFSIIPADAKASISATQAAVNTGG